MDDAAVLVLLALAALQAANSPQLQLGPKYRQIISGWIVNCTGRGSQLIFCCRNMNGRTIGLHIFHIYCILYSQLSAEGCPNNFDILFALDHLSSFMSIKFIS